MKKRVLTICCLIFTYFESIHFILLLKCSCNKIDVYTFQFKYCKYYAKITFGHCCSGHQVSSPANTAPLNCITEEEGRNFFCGYLLLVLPE